MYVCGVCVYTEQEFAFKKKHRDCSGSNKQVRISLTLCQYDMSSWSYNMPCQS